MPLSAPLPNRAGLGLKPEHYAQILEHKPELGFFEVHAENYMGAGGPPHRYLEAICAHYPLSLHGVGLSIGGEKPLDKEHLKRLRFLIDKYSPASFSEHLAWSTHDTGYFNDLLPLPYTPKTLDQVCAHVSQVQDALGVRMLLENPSTYVLFEESTIDEIDFMAAIAQRTGCGLLLDVNNVMVSAVNHKRDPFAYVEAYPIDEVGEIHLAGYDETEDSAGERLLIDAHGSAIRPDVFELFLFTLKRTGPKPVLVEWDNDVPDFDTLYAESRRAQAALDAAAGREMRAAQ
ncbi:DUF692 family multinuclear iron-containing protein [Pelagibacterium halotolerans]|uniref:MNIO family bufferin maturase n=1 Tax=Pelagibacterium halotolerans TaxID=531813 RepID=UPI00384D4C28